MITLLTAVIVSMAMTACKYESKNEFKYENAPEKNNNRMVAELNYGHIHYVIVLKEEKKSEVAQYN